MLTDDSFAETIVLLREHSFDADAPCSPLDVAKHLMAQSEHLLREADVLRAQTVGMLAGEATPYWENARKLEEYAKLSREAAEGIIDQAVSREAKSKLKVINGGSGQ